MTSSPLESHGILGENLACVIYKLGYRAHINIACIHSSVEAKVNLFYIEQHSPPSSSVLHCGNRDVDGSERCCIVTKE